MEKSDIRLKIKTLRTALSEAQKETASYKVFQKLEMTTAFLQADNILFYNALPDELPTQSFLSKWSKIKNLFLPRVNGVNLDILPYDESKITKGSFGIEEPVGCDVIDVDKIDLIIVPAVAFDHNCNRLGRGKGFYDRLLSNGHAIKIGVGYDFQLFEKLPIEKHDIPMDMIITESQTILLK